MTEPLHLAYRPRKFAEMVGQRLTAVVLDRMASTERVPSGLLFSGPSGTGKTTAARILSSHLAPEVDSALAVIEIDAASHGGVNDVRSLLESLRYSTGSRWRVVILDEAHSMTREAFNALLKTLEEPPPGVVFVLVTTEPHKIPETVRSRLMEFEFRRVSAQDIFDRVVSVAKAEQIDVATDVLQRIAVDAEGSVRRALMLLEKVSIAELSTLDAYLQATAIRDVSGRLLIALAEGQTARAWQIVDAALTFVGHPYTLVEQITSALRDVMILRAGGHLSLAGKALEDRTMLVSLLEADRVFAAIKILWDLKTRVRSTDDPRGSLDLALALIEEVFTRGRRVVHTTAPILEQDAAPAAPAPAVEIPPVPAPQPEAPVRRMALADLEI